MTKILITSALPYANGALHFGHIAGAYLPADVYARFMRMKKHEVLFICGSDEYGIAITLSAEQAGRSPQQHVDQYHEINKEIFQKCSISFDHYSRTTWPGHVETTHQVFLDLVHNDFIQEQETEQLYSEKEARFLADRYVVGTCPRCGFEAARGDECTRCGQSFEATDLKEPRSKMTGSPLVLKKTRHWFLRLDLFKDRLTEWIESKNWKPNVVNFVKSYINDLRPRAITRDMSWGIPVPLDHAVGKVLYVWFDAPIGYISATKEWALGKNDPDRWKHFWCDSETKLVQFIGKDNIPFHSVIFPAMIMGQNMPYKLVDELPANEFYNLEGRQFSKSDGWYIDVQDFLTRYSAEQIRYAIGANAPETQDSEFTWKDFQTRNNADLVGKFGNFIHRTLVFLQNQLGGLVPKRGTLDERDLAFCTSLQALVVRAEEAYSTFRVRLAAGILMEIASLGNVYFDAKKPWELARKPEKNEELQTVLSVCLECVQTLAYVASPLLPETAEKIWKLLGQTDRLLDLGWDQLREFRLMPGQKLSEPAVLFTKIEDETIAAEISRLAATCKVPAAKEQDPLAEPTKQDLISFDEVKKLDLRIAKIITAERVTKSKKLLKLQIDLGGDVRTMVSGIGHKFTPEEVVGKQVVVVANLQPATLMGVESQAMMLVASSPDDQMRLLECNDLPSGSRVS